MYKMFVNVKAYHLEDSLASSELAMDARHQQQCLAQSQQQKHQNNSRGSADRDERPACYSQTT